MFNLNESPYRQTLPGAINMMKNLIKEKDCSVEESISWIAIRTFIPCVVLREYYWFLENQTNGAIDEKTEVIGQGR
jgi:hypothetical protein